MYEFGSIRLLFPFHRIFLWIYSAFGCRGPIFTSISSGTSVKFIYLAIKVSRAVSVDLFFRWRPVVRSESTYFLASFAAYIDRR